MKYLLLPLILFIPSLLFGQSTSIKLSEDLELIPLDEHTYIHKSFTNSEKFGRFSSNGLIYIQDREVLIADTPSDTILTKLLVSWVVKQELSIKAVVVNHHHHDALGGLPIFHKLGIPSYGFIKTKALAAQEELTPPSHTFQDSIALNIGGLVVEAFFFGEGHTIDNTVLWIPDSEILFGGCMIKSLTSGKGNLEDANVDEWSRTVSRIKDSFQNVQIVIPGHGKHGGANLLDYTIKMFEK